jgi:hypothetical protein
MAFELCVSEVTSSGVTPSPEIFHNLRGQPRNWFGSVEARVGFDGVQALHPPCASLGEPSWLCWLHQHQGFVELERFRARLRARPLAQQDIWILDSTRFDRVQFGSVRLDSIDKSPAAPHCYCQGLYDDEPPSASDEEEENKWIFYKASASKDATIDNEGDDSSYLCTCRCFDCRRIQCHAQPSDGFQSTKIDPSSPYFATSGS